MLIAAGNGPAEGWRFGVLQTLDGYASTKRRGGVQLASHVFTEPPAPTGSKVASHDERMRFDGVTSILYVTDERTGHAIDRHIEQRVFVDDRPRLWCCRCSTSGVESETTCGPTRHPDSRRRPPTVRTRHRRRFPACSDPAAADVRESPALIG